MAKKGKGKKNGQKVQAPKNPANAVPVTPADAKAGGKKNAGNAGKNAGKNTGGKNAGAKKATAGAPASRAAGNASRKPLSQYYGNATASLPGVSAAFNKNGGYTLNYKGSKGAN